MTAQKKKDIHSAELPHPPVNSAGEHLHIAMSTRDQAIYFPWHEPERCAPQGLPASPLENSSKPPQIEGFLPMRSPAPTNPKPAQDDCEAVSPATKAKRPQEHPFKAHPHRSKKENKELEAWLTHQHRLLMIELGYTMAEAERMVPNR